MGGECLGRYPPSQAHPPGRCTLGSGTPPWAGTSPLGRFTIPMLVHPRAGTPSSRYTHPRQIHHPGRYTPHWSMSGRYASYWNAFLLDFSDSFPYFSEIQRETSTLNIKKKSNFNIFKCFRKIPSIFIFSSTKLVSDLDFFTQWLYSVSLTNSIT